MSSIVETQPHPVRPRAFSEPGIRVTAGAIPCQGSRWRNLNAHRIIEIVSTNEDEQEALLKPDEAEEIRSSHFLFNMPNAIFTSLFLTQLRQLRDGAILDTFHISDEIKSIEGVERRTSTKPATQFQRPPLKGLWHQHFFNPRFIPQNIGSHWKLGSGGSPELLEMFAEEMAAEESGIVTKGLINRIAYRFIDGAFRDRASAGRITGEWIIFAKHEGKNFYLTVGLHGEDDAVIYERVMKWCKPEFPFLFAG